MRVRVTTNCTKIMLICSLFTPAARALRALRALGGPAMHTRPYRHPAHTPRTERDAF